MACRVYFGDGFYGEIPDVKRSCETAQICTTCIRVCENLDSHTLHTVVLQQLLKQNLLAFFSLKNNVLP